MGEGTESGAIYSSDEPLSAKSIPCRRDGDRAAHVTSNDYTDRDRASRFGGTAESSAYGSNRMPSVRDGDSIHCRRQGDSACRGSRPVPLKSARADASRLTRRHSASTVCRLRRTRLAWKARLWPASRHHATLGVERCHPQKREPKAKLYIGTVWRGRDAARFRPPFGRE